MTFHSECFSVFIYQ